LLPIEWLVTLQPNFLHFRRFARDPRLGGIRLNNPHWTPDELREELIFANSVQPTVPLYFDVKGWQLRVIEHHPNDRYLDITLNHPIQVETPTVVIFKAGADRALLERVEEGGTRLIFRGGPEYKVRPGESLQIRDPSLRVLGDQFTPAELEKIEIAKQMGISRYFLSYVSHQADVDRLQELVGRDAEIRLKIETQQGLSFVANEFRKQPNLKLVAARGDLYVEVDHPHNIMKALQLIISKDPEACVGSRIMLSVIQEPVPSCADFLELGWLYDAGYRSMLLCDELCLKEDLLGTALNACGSFAENYQPAVPLTEPITVSKTATKKPAPPTTRRRLWTKWVPGGV